MTAAPRAIRRLTAVLTGAVLLVTGLATAPAASADRLDPLLTVGERLEQGDSLVSPSGRIRLQLDHFGGLKLIDRGGGAGYPGERVVRQYNSNEPSARVQVVVFQTDGNLVGYGAGGVPVVSFRTAGSGAVAARVQEDRNLVFTDTAGRPVRNEGTQRRLYLGRGDYLLPGDTMQGERGVSRLTMQSDGNLVLYRGSTALWSSRTSGNPGAYASMQGDGNLVVYPAPATGGRALFDTGTSQGPGVWPVELAVEDTEISVNYLLNGLAHSPRYPLWASNWASDRLLSGDELDEGDIRTSPDGTCVVQAVPFGFYGYCEDGRAWSTPEPADPFVDGVDGITRMQADGNLVTYRFVENSPRVRDIPFSSGTSRPGSYLVVQDDGNAVVRAPDGRPTWSRYTGRIG